MSDFPGNDQLLAVIARLESELRKTIIEAPRPRLFDGDHIPVSGGYDLTLPADGPPENWGLGRIATPDTPRDELCPILDDWRTRSLATGEAIEADDIAPFSQAELMDQVNTAADEVFHGAGLIGVSVFDVSPFPDPATSGIGREGQLHMPIEVACSVVVPSGRGAAQGLFYCGLVARVLTAATLQIAPDEGISFANTPEAVAPTESGAWLVFPFSVLATREYFVPDPKRTT